MTPMKRQFATMAMMALTCLMSAAGALVAEESPDPYANKTKEQRDARMAWWREAKFGMFIHWGVYAVPAGTYRGKRIGGIGEWIMNRGKIPRAEYQTFAGEFNPVKYDPDAWVRLASQAGMKYIVITSKHHDGFTLYPSAASDWGIGCTPYGKDLLKPLAEACRKHGLKLGFYYSQAQDWNNGGSGNTWDPNTARTMDEYIDQVAVPQVREILTNYGEFPAVLWWDTPRDMNMERAKPLIELLKLKPGIIHNNRLGGGFRGDTETPEQHIPATGFKDRDWETCMTMNGTWGFKSYDHNWKSTETLIRNLVDIVSKGGNYLLNVGPTAEGLIPEPSIEGLKEVGKWMDVNGEAIYGTSASPFAKLSWGRSTAKTGDRGASLYLHVFDWPQDGKLLVPGLRSTVAAASLLDGGAALETSVVEDGVLISLPATAPDPIAAVIKLELEGPLDIVKVKMLTRPGAHGVLTLLPGKAETTASIKIEQKGGQPNLGFWLGVRDTVSWTIKSQKAGTYRIEAEVAGTAPSEFTIACGDSSVAVASSVQDGYAAFSAIDLGTIDIGAGEQSLRITPAAGKWSPINVRALRLTPQ